jgi:hypothetical protein
MARAEVACLVTPPKPVTPDDKELHALARRYQSDLELSASLIVEPSRLSTGMPFR